MSANTLPQIAFGPYKLSRLIVGSNCIYGGSHLSRFVNNQMRRYFTTEQILQHFADCERAGINCWQAGRGSEDLLRKHRERGGQLQFIALASENPKDPDCIRGLAEAGTIGVAHHGEVTDVMFKEGRLEEAREFCKKVRDAGMQVGVSTHMPAVVDYIEDKGWDVDFYMTCVYERHRSKEELKALLGYVPLPEREVYLEEDPPRMWQACRQTSKPCLAFKILAAGRVCDRPELVEQAFEATFRHIKANDAVIVGMYPEYEDQVTMNAEYVRRFSGLSQG